MTYRRRVLGCCLLALLLLPLLWAQVFAATAGPQENVSNTTTQSEAPQALAIGAQLYAAWGERDTGSIVVSDKANGGAWPTATAFPVSANTKFQVPDLAATPNGTVHLTYAAGGSVFYRSRAAGSATWSAPNTIASDNFPNGVRLAAGKDGSLWTIWRDNDGTAIRYRRSTDGGATWTGGNVATQSGNMFGLDIAIDSNNVPHVVWYLLSSANGNTARYADWNGSTWTIGTVGGSSGFVADPVLTIDQNNVQYVAYRRQSSGSNWLIQYATRAPGQPWSAPVTVRTTNGDAQYGPGMAIDSKGTIHVTWSELNSSSGRDVWYSAKKIGQAFSPPVNVSENPGGWNSRSIIVLTEDANGVNVHIFYQRGVRGVDTDEVYYRRYTDNSVPPTPPPTSTPIPPAISGSLVINGDAAITRQPAVNITINNTSNTPATSYSLADGVQPPAPNTPFTNPQSASFTLDTADGQCRVHTVYGKLSNGTSVSNAFSDSIIYDPSAEAFTQARNPNSALNQPLTGVVNTLVPTGALAYTRSENFTLLVMAPASECTGLKRYAVVKNGAPVPPSDSTTWKNVGAAGYASALTFFTANVGQGQYQFDVYVEDNAGNTTATPYVVAITYDTEGPTVSGTTSDLPTTSSPKGGVTTIDTGSRTVTDNLYQGPSADQNYWGYWVMVKQTAAGAPSEDEWNKFGQIVPGQIGGPITWNMARGLVTPFQPQTNYTVYLRLLDGAGNWSTTLSSQQVLVNQLEFFGYMPLSQR